MPSLPPLPPFIKHLVLCGCTRLTNQSLQVLNDAHELQSLDLYHTNITELLFEFPRSLKKILLVREHFSHLRASLEQKYPTIEFELIPKNIY